MIAMDRCGSRHQHHERCLFDLTAGLRLAVDDYLSGNGRATDIRETAQQAAEEVLASLAGDDSVTLFESGEAEFPAGRRRRPKDKSMLRCSHE